MARFYADENFPKAVVEELRRFGHDVSTVFESGMANRATPDAEVLDLAIAERRVLLTLNRKHFIRLHAQRPITAGSWSVRLTLISRAKGSEFMRP